MDIVSAAAHGHGHVHAAGAHGQHTDAAAGGGVGVGADEGLAGLAEPLQMELVADAVAGAGEPDAVLCRHGLEVLVVVGVHEAALQCVVIHIGDGEFGFHLGDAHGLEFQIGHGAGGILGQGLVDFQGDFAAGGHFARNQVGADDLLCNCLTHFDETSRSW